MPRPRAALVALVAIAGLTTGVTGAMSTAAALPGGSYRVRIVNLFVPVNPSPTSTTTTTEASGSTTSESTTTASTTTAASTTTSTSSTSTGSSAGTASVPPLRVYDTTVPTKKTKPILEVDFGETSRFIKTTNTQSLSVAVKGQLKNHLFLSGPFKKGDHVTVVVYGANPDEDTGKNNLSNLNIGVTGNDKQSVITWPKVPRDKAELMIFAGALLGALPQDNSFFFVTPGEGCLKAVDPSDQDFGFGGNAPSFFVLEPGSTDVGAVPGTSDSGGCDGTPTIGPESVDAQAGERVVLIPYGTGPDDLQLLTLPVESP